MRKDLSEEQVEDLLRDALSARAQQFHAVVTAPRDAPDDFSELFDESPGSGTSHEQTRERAMRQAVARRSSSRRPPVEGRGRWVGAVAVAAAVAVIASGAVLIDRHGASPSTGGGPDPSSCDHHLVRDDSSKAADARAVDMALDYQPKTATGAPIRVSSRFVRPGAFPLRAVVTCQYADVEMEGMNSSYGRLEATIVSGHFQVRSDAGTGLLALVDSRTANREADDGSGAQDFVTFAGWYLTFVDPQPGTYHFSRDVIWSIPDGARQGAGTVNVTITVHETVPR